MTLLRFISIIFNKIHYFRSVRIHIMWLCWQFRPLTELSWQVTWSQLLSCVNMLQSSLSRLSGEWWSTRKSHIYIYQLSKKLGLSSFLTLHEVCILIHLINLSYYTWVFNYFVFRHFAQNNDTENTAIKVNINFICRKIYMFVLHEAYKIRNYSYL